MYAGDVAIGQPVFEFLMTQNSNNEIRFLHKSDIGKQLDHFDKLAISDKLEQFLSSDPSCIKLFQFLAKRRGYVFNEEVVDYFRKEYTSMKSFIIQRRCKRCNLLIEYISLADFNFKRKNFSYRPCQKCRTSIDIEENEYKQYQITDIISIFKYGMQCGIFEPFQYSICPFCKHEIEIDDKKERDISICIKCTKPVEIKVLFEINKDILDNLDIINSQGYWFDWYLGHIIKSKRNDISVKRNQIYRIGKREIEIDLLLEKNDNKTCISCSAEKQGKFDSEDFHLIRVICDKLILACPDNNIPLKIVDCAESNFRNSVSIIKLNDFCDIDSLIKNL